MIFAVKGCRPSTIMPVAQIKEALQKGKINTTGTRVHKIVWKGQEIGVALLNRRGQELAKIEGRIVDTLTFGLGNRLEKIKGLHSLLWRPGTSRLEEFGGLHNLYGTHVYQALNPFAKIDYYYLNDSLRGAGIGRDWYQKLIEPFFKKSGINTAIVVGYCLQEEALGFWRHVGFSNKYEMDACPQEPETFDGKEKLHYLTYKTGILS